MVLRSLQPRIARHVVGVPFTDFGSLVLALYEVEEGISRDLWTDSPSSDVKGKKPSGEQRPRAPHHAYDQTYMPPTLALPYHAVPRAQQTSTPFALRTQRQFSQLGMPGRHEADYYLALRHAIQDLIDQGLVHLEPEPMVSDEIYEIGGVTLGDISIDGHSRAIDFPTLRCSDAICLDSDVEEVQTPYVDDVHILDIRYVIRGGRVVRQQPPIVARPLEGTFTPKEGLIHLVIAGRATCIVFSDDDLPPDGLDHTRPLYISIVRAYDSTRREVMGTLEIELLIELELSLFPSSEGEVHSRWLGHHSATLEMEDFCRDFVAMSFDQHGSIVVLDIMRSMSYLPGMGLGRRQHRPSEFMAIPNHDVPFGLGFIPTEADYRYMV
ncbi:hypothetical protein AAG906_005686 [Vitis piasezkii]